MTLLTTRAISECAMWTRCSAFSAVLLLGTSHPAASAGKDAKLSTAAPKVAAPAEAAQPADQGLMALTVGKRRLVTRVTVDRASLGKQNVRDVVVLSQRGSLVVAIDSLPSRPQGLSSCQAGNEIYARVIDVRTNRERYAKLVESCLKPVISGSPPVTVLTGGRTVALRSWYDFARWDPVYASGQVSVTFDLLYEPPVTITLDDDGTFSARSGPADAGRR